MIASAANLTYESAAWTTTTRLKRTSSLRPQGEFGVRAHVRYAAGDPTPHSLAAFKKNFTAADEVASVATYRFITTSPLRYSPSGKAIVIG